MPIQKSQKMGLSSLPGKEPIFGFYVYGVICKAGRVF
jgi:hypothetical protein